MGVQRKKSVLGILSEMPVQSSDSKVRILNPEGPLSKRPRNLRQFWKDNPELRVDNLEKDFGWIAKQATIFRSIR